MTLATVVKFSSNDCGVCHRMSHYDAVVCKEYELDYVNVIMQEPDTYRRFRHLLLAKYPKKEGMGWPTYLVVTDPEGDFKIQGELKGGMSKGEFRSRLSEIIANQPE